MPAADDVLLPALRAAWAAQAALDDLRRLLERADAEIARLRPACLGGGACCKFDLTGSRLYVSTLELALLTRQAPARPELARRQRCPYQLGPRCQARCRRPLGCRVFFCSAEGGWMQDLYERYHAEIRLLHQRHALAYLYVELTSNFSGIGGLFCVDSPPADH